MTDTPHLEALAMRTRAAEAMTPMLRSMISRGYAADLILALPIEADPAALVAEALRLPEVRALVEAATEQAEYLSLCGEDGDLLRNLLRALQPFAALVQP